jgi:hypothetical protein
MSEERHYSVQEIAAAWGTDSGTIRRYFINEEGVEKIACSATRSRYLRWRLSIPQSVVTRVYVAFRQKEKRHPFTRRDQQGEVRSRMASSATAE